MDTSDNKRKLSSVKDELVNLIKVKKAAIFKDDFIPLSDSPSFSGSLSLETNLLSDLKSLCGFKELSDLQSDSQDAQFDKNDSMNEANLNGKIDEEQPIHSTLLINSTDKSSDSKKNSPNRKSPTSNKPSNDKSPNSKSPKAIKCTATTSKSSATNDIQPKISFKITNKLIRTNQPKSAIKNEQLVDLSGDSDSEIVIEKHENRNSFCTSEESIDLNDLQGYNDFNNSDLMKEPDDDEVSSSISSYCEIVDEGNDVEYDPDYGCIQMNVNLNSDIHQSNTRWSVFRMPLLQSKHRLINKSNTSIMSKAIESFKKSEIANFKVPSSTVVTTNKQVPSTSKAIKKESLPVYNFEYNQANYLQPWADPSEPYSPGIIGLHEEIEDFYEWSKLKPEEIKVRNFVFLKVKEVIKAQWPDAEVLIFGSYQTNLSLPFADLDIVIIKNANKIPFRTIQCNLIAEDLTTFEGTKIISTANVPIIKFIHKTTGINVDLSFNCMDGPRAIKLIKNFQLQYPTMPKLLLVLKLFLHQRKLNFSYTGGLSSYSLTLMLMSFYQQHPRRHTADKNANLGVLFMEFLELFGIHFDQKSMAIRIERGGQFIRKPMLKRLASQEVNVNRLCIEDPIDNANNPTKNGYSYEKVRKSFANAFYRLQSRLCQRGQKVSSKGMLGELVGYTAEELELRKRVMEFYRDELDTIRPVTVRNGFDYRSDFIPFKKAESVPDDTTDNEDSD